MYQFSVGTSLQVYFRSKIVRKLSMNKIKFGIKFKNQNGAKLGPQMWVSAFTHAEITSYVRSIYVLYLLR